MHSFLYWRLLPRALPSIYSARQRTPSSPIRLSEVVCKPFVLSQVFLLSSEGKSIVLAKKKVPSCSVFFISTYVVLKTRHANPNIHVRRFIVHIRSPNSFATRPQLLSLRGAATYYGFAVQATTRLHPIHRDPATKLYRHSAYTYSKARYTELCSQPKKRRKPSASPLARAGAWRYLDGAEL